MNTPRFKILAIDSEQLLLTALERAFKDRSIEIVTTSNVLDALEELRCNQFDLFLLDLELYDQPRLQLLKTIDERCPYVPVIIMTTTDPESEPLNLAIKANRKHGAWHILEKPFSLDRMLHCVEVVFQDQDHVQICLDAIAHNFDHEKRMQLRRPHVQSINYSLKAIVNGELQRTPSNGILTDISDHGMGVLSHQEVASDQMICFDADFLKEFGVVAWSSRIDPETYRFGVKFIE